LDSDSKITPCISYRNTTFRERERERERERALHTKNRTKHKKKSEISHKELCDKMCRMA